MRAESRWYHVDASIAEIHRRPSSCSFKVDVRVRRHKVGDVGDVWRRVEEMLHDPASTMYLHVLNFKPRP